MSNLKMFFIICISGLGAAACGSLIPILSPVTVIIRCNDNNCTPTESGPKVVHKIAPIINNESPNY